MWGLAWVGGRRTADTSRPAPASPAPRPFPPHTPIPTPRLDEAGHGGIDGGDLQQPHAVLHRRLAAAHAEERAGLEAWVDARHRGDAAGASTAVAAATAARSRVDSARQEARHLVDPQGTTNDTDYVFIGFILNHLPHGLIGLLVAAFFAAALSAKAAELNALGSASIVDVYRHVIRPQASDAHYLTVSKRLTVLWGVISVSFALSATLAENLIQAVNIIGSIFYPIMLGLFIVGFFLRWIGGTAVFWGALAAQALVICLFVLGKTLPRYEISYIWFNPLGCAACVLFSALIQGTLRRPVNAGELAPTA